MREAKLIIPTETNDGRSMGDVAKAAILRLVSTFGGATSTIGNGYWVSPSGQLFAEEVQVISVAVPETEHSKRILRGVAATVGKLGEQEAVYVAHWDGDVEFVSEYEVETAVAAE